MKRLGFIGLSVLLTLVLVFLFGKHRLKDVTVKHATPNGFRLQIPRWPEHLSWDTYRSSSGHYILHLLSCPLLRWGADNKIHPFAAKRCYQINPIRFVCELQDRLWSDGTPLTAEDYVNSYQRKINPTESFWRKDLLSPLKNAQKILDNSLPPSELGVKALGPKSLEFILEEPLAEFPYFLLSPFLSADVTENRHCGPFQIQERSPQRWVLVPNPTWFQKSTEMPPTIYVFPYEDENLAFKAYQTGDIDFLYRLPTALEPEWKSHPDYFRVDLLRLDGIFFRLDSKLFSLAPLLIHSIDYVEWQKLYHSPFPVGCLGLPDEWFTNPPVCTPQLVSHPTGLVTNQPSSVTLFYSKAGGSDHDRAMGYLALRWQQQLGWPVQMEPLENKVLIRWIEENKVDLYRKGLTLERPSCLAGLENFLPKAANNHLKYHGEWLESTIREMKKLDPQDPKYKTLCDQSFRKILAETRFIPTGRISFHLLIRARWTGWEINSLNHLFMHSLIPKN